MATGVFSSKDVSHVSKFNGTNFAFWKFQLTLILEQHELCDIVFGKCKRPDPLPAGSDPTQITARENVIKSWNKKDNSARCFIVSTIEEQAQRSLINCKNANEMWNRLKSQYEQTSEENKHYLLQKYYAYEYEEGNNITNHITTLETMATELSDVGMPLSEEQKVGRILMSLPKKFGHFHTSWQNVDSSKRTVQLLTTRLQTEEAFQDFKGLSVSDKDSALYSRSNKKRPNSKGTKSQVRFADEDTKPAHGGHRKSCAFCKRGGYKSSHREEDCYRKEAYIQGRRDAGDTAYAATSGTTKVTVSPPQQSDTSSDDGLAFMSNLPNSDKRGWYADSGSSTHMDMTDQRSLFDTFTAIQPGDRVVRGIGKDNKPLHALGIGEICIERKVNGRLITGKLYAVLYVPNLGVNLFSIGAAKQHGVTATFQDNQVTLSKNGKVVAAGTRSNQKLYRLDIVASQFKNDTEDFAALSQDDDIQLWHKRLGHVNFQTIKRMKSKDMIDGMQLNPSSSKQPICEGCIMGKHHRLPFPKDGRTRATRVGELIHSDVCGPITPCSIGGSRYFVIFKDDYSCFSFIEFMKEKSEVMDHFKNFAARMKTLTGQPVVTLRSDNGGEFMSLEFSAWLQEHGIKHETSIARTPEQNGVSERENRTVVESARSMLLTSRLPKNMWAEAVGCAIYLLNQVPCRATPDATHHTI